MNRKMRKLWWAALSLLLAGCGGIGGLGSSLGDVFKGIKLP
ncbi:MAG TPA: hypothetical protein VF813_03445 [Anaerolineaceae bacterium]